jgi:aminomethyltransferase
LKTIKANPLKKKLAGLEIQGAPMEMNMTRYPVKSGGHVTSLVYSPRLKKNIGYALVPAEYAAPGTRLEIEAPEGMRRATVVTMPFIDPDKAIAKS